MQGRLPEGVLPGFAVALCWFGFSAGVSFLATPAKFLAPSLSLPVALDVGRQTFAVLNKVEWVLATALLLLVAVLPVRRSWLATAGATAAAGLVLLEAVWLLPALDARVGIIIAGGTAPDSGLHQAYIAIEAAKLALLGLVAVVSGRQLGRPLALQ